MRIRDDRGRKLRTSRWWLRFRQRPVHQEMLAQTYARVERKSSPAMLLEEIITPLCAAGFFALAAALFNSRVHWTITAALAGAALIFLALACVRPFTLRREIKAGRKHFRSLVASSPVCTTCGYSIADLTPESDGCTVCPECGAAWRLRYEVQDCLRQEDRPG